jgi:hydroxyacylglutathione hydrolase
LLASPVGKEQITQFASESMKAGKLQIRQFRYNRDNFSYLIFNDREAVVIDGGAVEVLAAFLHSRSLQLRLVLNTHNHGDHTSGNRALLQLADLRGLEFGNEHITVYPTPGHTEDSICFHLDRVLITGDTLFNGTVGNCFSGDMLSFYDSLMMLCGLPDTTVIYAGHDYVRSSVVFARRMEPANSDLDQYLERYDPQHVRSLLQDELLVNPYLRFNQETIVSVLRRRYLPVATAYERWRSLMSID